jgi:hypothetical protein
MKTILILETKLGRCDGFYWNIENVMLISNSSLVPQKNIKTCTPFTYTQENYSLSVRLMHVTGPTGKYNARKMLKWGSRMSQAAG